MMSIAARTVETRLAATKQTVAAVILIASNLSQSLFREEQFARNTCGEEFWANDDRELAMQNSFVF